MVVVKGSEEKATKLREALQENEEEVVADNRKNEKTLYILDIDEVATVAEVRKALEAEIGKNESVDTTVKVISLKTAGEEHKKLR